MLTDIPSLCGQINNVQGIDALLIVARSEIMRMAKDKSRKFSSEDIRLLLGCYDKCGDGLAHLAKVSQRC